jgi:hypothetical protein
MVQFAQSSSADDFSLLDGRLKFGEGRVFEQVPASFKVAKFARAPRCS